MKLNGYVIVPPLSPWDEKHADKIIPQMSYRNLGNTPPEAWSRFMGTNQTDLEWSRKVQHWHDRGYRVKKATLDIQMESDVEPQIGKMVS